ncbi:MAG: proline dehydrogenase family protein [Bacteroidota bacterium]
MEPRTTKQVQFDDTKLAFQAKSEQSLKRTYQLFQLIDSPFLTKVGPPILQAALRIGLPIQGMVKKTLFDIFCGGETIAETESTATQLYRFGVSTILDYSVEAEKTEAGFDETLRNILETLEQGKNHREVAFSACKLTGLASFSLMEQKQAGTPFSSTEEAAYLRAKERLERICKKAVEARTPVFIDAEESWIQETIDRLAEEMMERYNTSATYVYTTIQLYRHDRLAYLTSLIKKSKEKGYQLGVKLVRGAYMEKEAERALEHGYSNPIQPSREATHRDFNAALALCIENIHHVNLCAGTHNEESCYQLMELMETAGVGPEDKSVWFSQLLGMSDHISFNLSHAGYNVAKYVPFGPVKAVIPYLMRRAEENTAIAGQSSREVSLLRKEMKRRRL